MKSKKSWLLVVPVSATALAATALTFTLTLAGCGGGLGQSVTSGAGATPTPGATTTPAATPTPATTPSPTPSPSPTPTPAGPSSFPLTNITDDSNVNRTPFTPSAITGTYDPFERDSISRLVQVTGTDALGEALTRTVEISENSLGGNFEDNVGRTFPIGTGGVENGVPTVLVAYRQADGSAVNGRQWRAQSGTLVIDSYSRTSPTTEVVTFRLIEARFQPFFNAAGSFTLSVNGTTSGQ